MGAIATTVFKGVVAEAYDPIPDVKFGTTVFMGLVVEDINAWNEIEFLDKAIFKGVVTEIKDILFPQIIRRL